MANLLNKSRFFLFLTGICRVHRLGLTLISFVSIFIFWLFFFYFPLEQLIQQQETSQNDLEKLYVSYNQSLKTFDSIKNENEQLLVQFKKTVFTENASENRLDFILSLLKKNNISCLKFNPYQHEQKEFYHKDYYVLKAKGKFTDITSFFNELEKSACTVKFKDSKFERRDKNIILFETKIRMVKFLKSV